MANREEAFWAGERTAGEQPGNAAREHGARVLVCGGRDFGDAELFGAYMSGFEEMVPIACIIEGAATGTDFLARKYGEWRHIPVLSFAADWRRLGRAAAAVRNKRMLEEGKPDTVIAFPGGRGAEDLLDRARAAGLRVFEIPTDYGRAVPS